MDKVALVTGGSKGIGYACAERLLADGYAVAFCARQQPEIDAAAAHLSSEAGQFGSEAGRSGSETGQFGSEAGRSGSEAGRSGRGDRVLGLRADVGSVDDCAGLVAAVIERFGRIDVLVNNAGVYAPVPFLDFTAASWDALMDINLRGPVLISGLAARAMRERGGGRIVHIASTNGQLSEAEFAHYNASKAAIISLTKSMAVELAPFGILVNAVAPGWVLTPLSEPFVATLDAKALARISPLRRVGEAAEVAGAVSFLCGPDATYVTGITLNVDGGLTAMHPAV